MRKEKKEEDKEEKKKKKKKKRDILNEREMNRRNKTFQLKFLSSTSNISPSSYVFI
jgi:hypothetical protein